MCQSSRVPTAVVCIVSMYVEFVAAYGDNSSETHRNREGSQAPLESLLVDRNRVRCLSNSVVSGTRSEQYRHYSLRSGSQVKGCARPSVGSAAKTLSVVARDVVYARQTLDIIFHSQKATGHLDIRTPSNVQRASRHTYTT
jgi:hypothetical protein